MDRRERNGTLMESIVSLWDQIEDWLNTHYPQMWATTRPFLAPGASEEAVHRAEAALGVTLPEDFKAFYRLHNGEGAGFFLDHHEFLSLEGIIGTWQMYTGFLRDGTYAGEDNDVTV